MTRLKSILAALSRPRYAQHRSDSRPRKTSRVGPSAAGGGRPGLPPARRRWTLSSSIAHEARRGSFKEKRDMDPFLNRYDSDCRCVVDSTIESKPPVSSWTAKRFLSHRQPKQMYICRTSSCIHQCGRRVVMTIFVYDVGRCGAVFIDWKGESRMTQCQRGV